VSQREEAIVKAWWGTGKGEKYGLRFKCHVIEHGDIDYIVPSCDSVCDQGTQEKKGDIGDASSSTARMERAGPVFFLSPTVGAGSRNGA